MAKVFTCSECGDTLPSRMLSEGSLAESEMSRRREAVDVLDHPVCLHCEEEADLAAPTTEGVITRSDRERFEIDGLYADPAKWAAYCQSY